MEAALLQPNDEGDYSLSSPKHFEFDDGSEIGNETLRVIIFPHYLACTSNCDRVQERSSRLLQQLSHSVQNSVMCGCISFTFHTLVTRGARRYCDCLLQTRAETQYAACDAFVRMDADVVGAGQSWSASACCRKEEELEARHSRIEY
jgi:hypothetical protein